MGHAFISHPSMVQAVSLREMPQKTMLHLSMENNIDTDRTGLDRRRDHCSTGVACLYNLDRHHRFGSCRKKKKKPSRKMKDSNGKSDRLKWDQKDQKKVGDSKHIVECGIQLTLLSDGSVGMEIV